MRTQISLEPAEYEMARKEAEALGISVAEYVRRVVRDALPVNNDLPWMRYAGFVESGDPRSSELIDEIVYGSKD